MPFIIEKGIELLKERGGKVRISASTLIFIAKVAGVVSRRIKEHRRKRRLVKIVKNRK